MDEADERSFNSSSSSEELSSNTDLFERLSRLSLSSLNFIPTTPTRKSASAPATPISNHPLALNYPARGSWISADASVWDFTYSSAYPDFVRVDKYPERQRGVMERLGRLLPTSSIQAMNKKLTGREFLTNKIHKLSRLGAIQQQQQLLGSNQSVVFKKKRSMADGKSFVDVLTKDGLIQIFKLAILDNNTLLALSIYPDLSFDAVKTNYANLKYYFLRAMSARLEQICIFMVEYGFPLNINEPVCRREECIMPSFLLVALSFNLDKLVRVMLRMSPDLHKSWYGITPVILATLKGNNDILVKLVNAGGSLLNGLPFKSLLVLRRLNTGLDKDRNALFYSEPVRQYLLSNTPKSKVDMVEYMKRKVLPIEIAIASSSYSTTLALNQLPIPTSHFGFLLSSDLGVLKSLSQLGADPAKHYDAYGSNALHLACRNGELDKAIFLIKLGVNIDLPGESGWTALQEALTQRKYDLIQYLILSGANAFKKNNSGLDSFDVARKVGFSLDQIEFYLVSPAHPSKFKFNEQTVETLIKTKKNSGAMNEYGSSKSVPSSPKMKKRSALLQLSQILKR